MLTFLGCLALSASLREPLDLDGPIEVVSRPLDRLEITLTQRVQRPGEPIDRWTAIVPVPPTLGGQQVRKAEVYIPGFPDVRPRRLMDAGPVPQPYFQADWAASGRDREDIRAQLIVDVVIFERSLRKKASGEVPFPLGAARRAYLAATPEIPHEDAGFRQALREAVMMRGENERDLKFAYRVLELLMDEWILEWDATANDAPTVFREKSGSSLGMANLYMAILRANNIPARALVGRLIDKQPETSLPYAPFLTARTTFHATIEFYAEGVGWVPVDVGIAMAGTDVNEYFGRTHGYHLVLHTERIQLPTQPPLPLGGFFWGLTPTPQSESAKVIDKVDYEVKEVKAKPDGR